MKKTTQSTIALSSIVIEDRFRKDYGDSGKKAEDHESFEALKKSIEENGLISPVCVVAMKEGKYRLIAGGRRMRAVTELGWKEVPCHIFPIGTSHIDERILELLENTDRKSLSWLEESQAIAEIDKLMKEKHGAVKRGSKIENTDGSKKWSTEDTSKLVGMSERSVNRNIQIAEAAQVFPKEIAVAKSRDEALAKLERIKAESGVPLLSEEDKEDENVTKLKKSIKTLVWRKEKFEDAQDKLKVWKPNLVLLTRRLDPEQEEVVEDITGGDCWIISMMEPSDLRAFVLTPARVGVSPDRLQENIKEFWYAKKGKPQLNKKGRSAVFQFKNVPSGIRITDTELPIEFWQELIETFVGKDGRVLVPFCEEGNMLLAGVNLGVRIFGFSQSDELYDSYCKKVDIFLPGKYTSFPGSLSNVKEGEDDEF